MLVLIIIGTILTYLVSCIYIWNTLLEEVLEQISVLSVVLIILYSLFSPVLLFAAFIDVWLERFLKKNVESPTRALDHIPEHILDQMLKYQEQQGNPKDLSVFEKNLKADRENGGFNWNDTIEGGKVWSAVLIHNKFHLIPAFIRTFE